MKKPASSNQTEKSAKRTPEEKSARKSEKNAGRAAAGLNDDRATKKASQKKSLKSAAKQLQKELNGRMNEVVTRIRKETKAKLKEVVKEATRRLDGDTERMFEQALHTIVRHYDSVAGTTASTTDNDSAASSAPSTRVGTGQGKIARGTKKGQTLNKDGSPRKARVTASATAANVPDELGATPAKTRARKPAAAKASTTGAKRGPKSTVAASSGPKRGPKPGTPATGAKRGPKPRIQAVAAPEANDVMSPADSASTGEVSA